MLKVADNYRYNRPMDKQSQIRVKALAWIEDKGMLFVVKMHDAVKGDDYYRPVGGSVEFGERSHEAVVREVREELSTEIDLLAPPFVVENPVRSAMVNRGTRSIFSSRRVSPTSLSMNTSFIAWWK